jgi:drug/metabolite transporter (DMT)-like permease
LSILSELKHGLHFKSKKTSFFVGIVLALLAAIFISTINIVGKALSDPSYGFVDEIVHPLNMAIFLGLISGLLFTPFARGTKSPRKFGRKTLIFVIIMGVADVIGITTNFFGLQHTTATNATILINTETIFVILIAIIIFKEKLQKRETLPLGLIAFGSIIIPLGLDIVQNQTFTSGFVVGDMMILAAAGIFAIDISISRFLVTRIPDNRIMQISAFVGVPTAMILMLIFQIPFDIPWEHMPIIVYLGIFVSGLSYYFFLVAIRLIGAIRGILIYSSSTAFGIFFSAIFLGEEITPLHIVSIIVIIVGIYLLKQKIASMEE